MKIRRDRLGYGLPLLLIALSGLILAIDMFFRFSLNKSLEFNVFRGTIWGYWSYDLLPYFYFFLIGFLILAGMFVFPPVRRNVHQLPIVIVNFLMGSLWIMNVIEQISIRQQLIPVFMFVSGLNLCAVYMKYFHMSKNGT